MSATTSCGRDAALKSCAVLNVSVRVSGPSKENRDAAKRPDREFCAGIFAKQTRVGSAMENTWRNSRRKLLRLVRECGWAALRDIAAHSFEAWRAHDLSFRRKR